MDVWGGGQLGRCRPEVVSSAEQEVGAREQRRPDGGQGTLAVRAAQAVLVPPTTHCAQQPALLDRPTTSLVSRSKFQFRSQSQSQSRESRRNVWIRSGARVLVLVWSQEFGLGHGLGGLLSVLLLDVSYSGALQISR